MESKEVDQQIQVSEINVNDWRKIKRDLRFIQSIVDYTKDNNLRVVISGDYAIDGNLGQITRPHNDIDIQVYGNQSEPVEAVKHLMQFVMNEDEVFLGLQLKDKGRQEYYHSFFIEIEGFGADVYYIQVVDDPKGEEKRVVKRDGTQNEPQKFDTNIVTLLGVSFEAENPTSSLVDILYKRNIRGDIVKNAHEQDITNLHLITEADEVEIRLGKLSKA